MRLCVFVCMRTCTYVYVCNSGPPIACFGERDMAQLLRAEHRAW